MRQSQDKGFFLIEVLVATSIITVVLIFLLGSIQDSVEVSKRSLETTIAGYLLEEGAEAVKAIRDQDWAKIPTDSSTYYLVWNGSMWSLSTTPNTTDIYTRTVTFVEVNRDTNDDIVFSGGTQDEGTRRVIINTSWSAPSGPKSENLEFFIGNIRKPVPNPNG